LPAESKDYRFVLFFLFCFLFILRIAPAQNLSEIKLCVFIEIRSNLHHNMGIDGGGGGQI